MNESFKKPSSEEPITGPDAEPDTDFDTLAESREDAEYIKDKIIYTGIFFDPDEIYSYSQSPPSFHKIRDPHITVAYRPDATKIFLDALGTEFEIRIIAYGNDGENEGFLAEVIGGDPAITEALNTRTAYNAKTGKDEPVPIHITLSIADGAKAVNTKNLDFQPLETPIYLNGTYKLFSKDGTLISDTDTVRAMRESGSQVSEVQDPDRL